MPELTVPPHPWACPGGTRLSSGTDAESEWLGKRKGLIGGSEVAKLFGLSTQYGDAHTLWALKTGRMPDEPTSAAARRGQLFEDAVLDLWAEHYAGFPIKFRRQGLMRSRQFPHIGATVDRLSVCNMDGGQFRCVTEIKTAARMDEWEGDEVPAAYQFQGQAQLIVTGRDHVHYVVMGPRFQPLHRLILIDPELMNTIGHTVEAWWQRHIIEDAPPAPTSASMDAIKRVNFRATPDKRHVIDTDLAPHVHALLDARADKADAEERAATAQAIIMAAMGDATHLVWPEADGGGLVATWNPSRTIDGATKAWRAQHPEVVDRYSVPTSEFVPAKAVEDDPALIGSGGLRYRRTFDVKVNP